MATCALQPIATTRCNVCVAQLAARQTQTHVSSASARSAGHAHTSAPRQPGSRQGGAGGRAGAGAAPRVRATYAHSPDRFADIGLDLFSLAIGPIASHFV